MPPRGSNTGPRSMVEERTRLCGLLHRKVTGGVEQRLAVRHHCRRGTGPIRDGFGHLGNRRVPQVDDASFRSRYQSTVRASPSFHDTAGS